MYTQCCFTCSIKLSFQSYLVLSLAPQNLRNLLVYSLYKKHFKNEQRSRDAAAAKKRANTSGVGKINNYCEDIYIPPYNNTH